ncbi:MAG: hypothetical protein QW323_01485, partial [Candidatus Bathyarchaeia archaeon]
EADALQIQTCIYSESKLLLNADEDLINTALKKGIRAINIKDESKVEASLRTAMKNSSKGTDEREGWSHHLYLDVEDYE